MQRRVGLLTLAIWVVAACGQGTSRSPAPTPLTTPLETLAPTVGRTLTPTEDPNASLIAAARTYAVAAGFDLLPNDPPRVRRQKAGYEPTVMWEVSLALSVEGGNGAVRVYFDDGGLVRVVESDIGFKEPSGTGVTRAEALELAAAALRLAGLEATSDQLEFGPSVPGRQWTVLLNRTVTGYPVANHWASTGIVGDRAWVTLRGDGRQVELYAVQPATQPIPVEVMANDELDKHLASAAGLSVKALRTLGPQLTWIRALDEGGAEANTLTLAYCATRTEQTGWEAWCIDASTGVRNYHSSAAD